MGRKRKAGSERKEREAMLNKRASLSFASWKAAVGCEYETIRIIEEGGSSSPPPKQQQQEEGKETKGRQRVSPNGATTGANTCDASQTGTV